MTYSVTLSPDVYQLLRQRARQECMSPDALAEAAVRQHLAQADPSWQQALDALLAKVQARTAQFDSAEIESDITAASLEAEELRRARRRTG